MGVRHVVGGGGIRGVVRGGGHGRGGKPSVFECWVLVVVDI